MTRWLDWTDIALALALVAMFAAGVCFDRFLRPGKVNRLEEMRPPRDVQKFDDESETSWP